MGCELIVVAGRGRRRRLQFEGESVCIGRGGGNDVIVNEAGVSRTHARIQRQGEAWILLDCGSANGTEVNHSAIASPVRLRDGDRLRVGSVVLEFDGTEGRARGGPTVRRAVIAGSAALLLVTAALVAAGRRRTVETPSPPAVGPAVAPAGAGIAGARAAYERGRRRLEERRVAPRNLYDAWTAFLEARRALAGVTPRPAFSPDLDRRIEACERELRRDCSRLLFAAARFEKYGQDEQALQIFREVLMRFPGEDPSGCRQRAQERIGGTTPHEGIE